MGAGIVLAVALGGGYGGFQWASSSGLSENQIILASLAGFLAPVIVVVKVLNSRVGKSFLAVVAWSIRLALVVAVVGYGIYMWSQQT